MCPDEIKGNVQTIFMNNNYVGLSYKKEIRHSTTEKQKLVQSITTA